MEETNIHLNPFCQVVRSENISWYNRIHSLKINGDNCEKSIYTKEKKDAHKERTDSCAVPAASIIAESMMCIVLADVILEKFGGDSLKQLRAHLKASAKYWWKYFW